MRLPDPERSRVVLIGTSRYQDSEYLPELPAVRTTIQDLRARLTHPTWGIVPPQHCTVILDEPHAHVLAERVSRAAETAEDCLLVYFAGHGLVSGRRHELVLGMYHSLWENRPFGSVPYEHLRGMILDSPARTKTVILDCCFSGRALGETLSPADAVDQLEVDGSYLLVSSPGNEVSLALPGERNTAFTGRLLQVLQHGVAGADHLLTMDDVFRQVRSMMRAQNLPEPQKKNTGRAEAMSLSKNVAHPIEVALITARREREAAEREAAEREAAEREAAEREAARREAAERKVAEQDTAQRQREVERERVTAMSRAHGPSFERAGSSTELAGSGANQTPHQLIWPRTRPPVRMAGLRSRTLASFVAVAGMITAGTLVIRQLDDNQHPSGALIGSETTALTVYNTAPEEPLTPGDTIESGGGNILDNVFRGLVKYAPGSSAPEMAMAESIESTDSLTWTVKLKTGNTFQDGTAVTANSFVKAWNWASYGPNAALNSYYFAGIEGWDVLNPLDPDGEGPKKAKKPTSLRLSGLRVVNSTEFTVTLATPRSFFPVEVGSRAFFPLPESFYDDPKAFGKKPVGNGPFKIVSGDAASGFTLERWAGYRGSDVPKIARATLKTFSSDTAAYADLVAGNLDFMDQVPPGALVDDQYRQDLPGRTESAAMGVVQTATLPTYVAGYDDPDLGKALSLAIDRPAIVKAVYNGGRIPASGWVAPVAYGYQPGACGEFCTYDPVKARTYLARARFKGPFAYSYNEDGQGNKEGAEAICASIRTALSVACQANPYADFSGFLKRRAERKMKSLFRTGWLMDYPALQNFLEPLYATDASANDGLYSNSDFDALITQANAEMGEAGRASYRQAEALLAKQMAVLPLWYQARQSGWSEQVKRPAMTPFNTIDLALVTVN